MTKNFKLTKLALAVGLLGLGAVAQNAYAGAYTYSSSIVTAQLFNVDASGGKGTAVTASQFSTLASLDSSNTGANLNSVPGISADIQSTSGDSAQAFQTNPTPPGTAPAAENTVTQAGSGSWYSRADTNLTGALIVGLPATVPATSSNVSEISLTGNDIGSSSANVNNNTGFVFSLVGSQQVFIDLTGITATQSFLTANAVVPPSITGSSSTWLVTVTDNALSGAAATVFSWTANKNLNAADAFGGTELSDAINLNFGSSVSSAGSNTGLISDSGAATARTGFLTGGKSYTLRIASTTSADSTNFTNHVPEPSIMGLMGMGLLGFGATRLRRHKAG